MMNKYITLGLISVVSALLGATACSRRATTMNRLSILGLSAMLAAGLASSPGSAVAQQKSLKEQLVGAWLLVSCDLKAADGTTMPFCVNSSGSLSLDASGRYIEVYAARGRPKFTAGRNSPADEYKAAAQGFGANFGTWSANDADKIITLHIEGALFPNREGTDEKDMVTIVGDELRLVEVGPPPGVEVWRRAK